MHFAFALVWAALMLLGVALLRRAADRSAKKVLFALWALTVVLEITKIVWETVSGKTVSFEWTGVLPLYPCSIFMYAAPFAIFGKGLAARAGWGYICTLGLLGGAINFVYPANILSNYSCLSFSGFHTFFYHGTIVFFALYALSSGKHSYRAKSAPELVMPAAPFLVMSLAANAVNFSQIGSDYMFFRLNSFIFAPLGRALPTALCVVITYAAYGVIHILPYLPSYISAKTKKPRIS
jgi:hypothetical protein